MTEDHSQHDREIKARILEDVEKFGCHLALLEANDYLTGYAYTIGLFKTFGHPEIICFGLHPDVLAPVLNQACDLVRQGETITPGILYDGFLEGYPIQFIEVDKSFYPNYVGYGCWYYDYRVDFPLLQLVWPDKQHIFPWDSNFNPNWKFKQPLLDRNTDFKFYEERDLCVYTTKQAYQGDPILYVYHNDDGAWQFHTSADPRFEDAMLVSLEQITKLDPTVNDMFHLQYGWHAKRASKEDRWEWEEDNRSEDD